MSSNKLRESLDKEGLTVESVQGMGNFHSFSSSVSLIPSHPFLCVKRKERFPLKIKIDEIVTVYFWGSVAEEDKGCLTFLRGCLVAISVYDIFWEHEYFSPFTHFGTAALTPHLSNLFHPTHYL